MKYRVEVLTKTYHLIHGDQEDWRPIRPSGGGAPYEWGTRREAEAMRDLCYPGVEHAQKVRVVGYEDR